MAVKKSAFLIIVLSISLVSAAFAGEHRKLLTERTVPTGDTMKESAAKLSDNNEASFLVHPRILAVKTNDYGQYDPAPAFSKPRFKLIPN